MQINKKTAIVAGVAAGALAIGGTAWAFVTTTGSGGGTATTTATAATLTLTANAAITDLDTVAPINISGASSLANRNIGQVTVSLAPNLPAACNPTWFRFQHGADPAVVGGPVVSNLSGVAPAGHTFLTANATDDLTGEAQLTITLVNDPDNDQTACVAAGGVPLTITAP